MARMLGRFRRSPVRGCRSMDHLCGRCSDGGETRWRKRQEQRELEREFAGWASWHDSAEGREWLERGLAEAEGWPGWDFSDCRHGCNGDCIARGTGSEVCDFTCHPGLESLEDS
jgi:hypothetical protein